jgi:hypothetical protein
MTLDAVECFRGLGLPDIAEAIETWSRDASNIDKPHSDFAQFLAVSHANHLAAGKESRLVRRCQLPGSGRMVDVEPWMLTRGVSKQTLATLAQGQWVKHGHHVVITGGHGTGKTTLATALAREAIAGGGKAAYARLPELLTELMLADEDWTFEKVLRKWARPDVLVLDDFTEEPIKQKGCRLLRRLVDARHRVNKSVVVATSAEVEEWDAYFRDTTARSAIYARLLPNAIRLRLTAP